MIALRLSHDFNFSTKVSELPDETQDKVRMVVPEKATSPCRSLVVLRLPLNETECLLPERSTVVPKPSSQCVIGVFGFAETSDFDF